MFLYGPGRDRRDRRAYLMRWTARAWLFLGTPSLVFLWMVPNGLVRRPAIFDPLGMALNGGVAPDTGWLTLALLIGAAGGVVVGTTVARVRGRALRIGRSGALLPKDRSEIAPVVAIACTAGIVEELFFRFALPLAVAWTSGSALAGFALATAAFAWAHRWQGWVGMAGSAAMGMLAAALYLYSGALWLAMLAHVVLDLNGLILRPLTDRTLFRSGDGMG